MTHQKKMQGLRRFIGNKLIESYENGKKPIHVATIAKSRRTSRINVLVAGNRAIKKLPFPVMKDRDQNFIANSELFKPIVSWTPATNENKIEWLESIEYTKSQSQGLAEIYNDQIRKGKEVKLLTEKRETQLLLPM